MKCTCEKVQAGRLIAGCSVHDPLIVARRERDEARARVSELEGAAAKVVIALLYDAAMPRKRREQLAFDLDAAVRNATPRHSGGEDA